MEKKLLEDISTFREVKPDIEKTVQHFLENKEEITSHFFGVKEGILSSEEVENFTLFATYALKRILSASIQKSGVMKDAIGTFLDEKREKDPYMYIHDIAHAISAYHKSSAQGTTSVVPIFYTKGKNEEVNNKQMIHDETRALLFMSPFRPQRPVPLALLDPKESIKLAGAFEDRFSHSPFEYNTNFKYTIARVLESIDHLNDIDEKSFIKTYKEVVYGLAEVTNTLTALNTKKPNEISLVRNEYMKIIQDLKSDEVHPDVELNQMLRHVFENKDDPKVLYDLFYQICKPLIDQLKKRKSE